MTAEIGPGWMLPQLPERTVFRDDGDTRHIRTEWRRGRGYARLIGSAVCMVILTVLWGGLSPDDQGFWATVLTLCFLAAILASVYTGLAHLLNCTEIRIDPGGITVRIAPIPWRGNKAIPAAELRQVYVEKERGLRPDDGDLLWPDYRVMAITGSLPDIRVIGDLPTKEQGWFIESQIEDYYAIDDRPVPTEIPKGRR